jgi:hypothetical protein
MSRSESALAPPSPEVLAAIVAAVEVTWPKPGAALGPSALDAGLPRWRFAGRWWSKPIPARRDRPF